MRKHIALIVSLVLGFSLAAFILAVVLVYWGISSIISHGFISSNPVSTENVAIENRCRRGLNLPEIKSTWYLYSSEYNTDKWRRSQFDSCYEKEVQRDPEGTGVILSESDIYFNGKQYDTREGKRWEELTITYDYEPLWQHTGDDTGRLKYSGTDPGIIAMLNKLDDKAPLEEKLSVADQILEKWGMTRFTEQEKEP
jgi:hypothetical protein